MSKLSVSLIVKRNVKHNCDKPSAIHALKPDALLNLTHVRLDRECIEAIDNLECLGSVTNLYLQHNLITKIENLECLSTTLQFLTLAANQIQQLRGMVSLSALRFLDLSDNKIEILETTELPTNLICVLFQNNPCALHPAYRADLIKALPNVKTIDGEAVHAVNSPESEESDSDQECTETVQDTGTAVLLRSLSRLDEVVAEHNSRLNLIKQHDNLPDEKFSVGSNSLDQSGLNSVEKRINSILHVMVEKQNEVLCTFDIPVSSEQNSETVLHEEKTVACADQPSFATQHTPATTSRENKHAALVSVGTTTSTLRASAKSEANLPLTRRTSQKTPSPHHKIGLPTDKRRTGDQRRGSNSVVRIAGARPFHKA